MGGGSWSTTLCMDSICVHYSGFIYGEVLCIKEDEDGSVGSGRVCIKTSHMDKITAKMADDNGGHKFTCFFIEASYWIPTIENIDQDEH